MWKRDRMMAFSQSGTIRSGVSIIGNVLETTLGLKGTIKVMDLKGLVGSSGAFILKNLLIDNGSGKMIGNSSIKQDWCEDKNNSS